LEPAQQRQHDELVGSPLDIGTQLDPNGVTHVVIEFEGGDSDTFRPKQRDEFGAYELHQMAAYLDSVAVSIAKSG
jgi:hypothetical protein